MKKSDIYGVNACAGLLMGVCFCGVVLIVKMGVGL